MDSDMVLKFAKRDGYATVKYLGKYKELLLQSSSCSHSSSGAQVAMPIKAEGITYLNKSLPHWSNWLIKLVKPYFVPFITQIT